MIWTPEAAASSTVEPVCERRRYTDDARQPARTPRIWTPQFRLRAADAVRVVGVIAGDDSLDLAEHTGTLQDGDYVLFDGANSEIVRLRANLDLGRRRLVGDIKHTYPTATLSRTNWLITAGQATAMAGWVYHSDTLRLHRDATGGADRRPRGHSRRAGRQRALG